MDDDNTTRWSAAANDPTTVPLFWTRGNLGCKKLANQLLYALAIFAPFWILLMRPPHLAIAFVWGIVFLRLISLKK